jgi:hypothetical protein
VGRWSVGDAFQYDPQTFSRLSRDRYAMLSGVEVSIEPEHKKSSHCCEPFFVNRIEISSNQFLVSSVQIKVNYNQMNT